MNEVNSPNSKKYQSYTYYIIKYINNYEIFCKMIIIENMNFLIKNNIFLWIKQCIIYFYNYF